MKQKNDRLKEEKAERKKNGTTQPQKKPGRPRKSGADEPAEKGKPLMLYFENLLVVFS